MADPRRFSSNSSEIGSVILLETKKQSAYCQTQGIIKVDLIIPKLTKAEKYVKLVENSN